MHIRKSRPSDIPFMKEMLYEAVFWRPNPNKPPLEEYVTTPGTRNAIDDWGEKHGDTAGIAVVNSKPTGAAWYRFYTQDKPIRGYINDTIPVIVIAIHEDHRGQGIGQKLIEWLLDQAAKQNIKQISLMVSKDNYAIKLYKKCGFIEYEDTGDSSLMVRDLRVQHSIE